MRFVQTLCRMHERGGQCFQIAEDTLVVHNVPHWTPEMTARLMHAYPTCAIEVMSHDASASGFKILIRNYGGNIDLSALVTILVALIAAWLSIQQLLQMKT
jgi:hypothetical protein